MCQLEMLDGNGYDVLKAFIWFGKKPKDRRYNRLGREDLKVDLVASIPFDFSELAKNII